MATGRQAIDNVLAGNVRLANNHYFILANYQDNIRTFTSPPSSDCVLTVDVTGAPEEKIITLKDGSYFGYAYAGGNSVYAFAKIPDTPIRGNTPVGDRPYTHYWLRGYPGGVEVQIGGQTVDAYTTKMSLTWTMQPGGNVIYSIDFVAEAVNNDYMYHYVANYGEPLAAYSMLTNNWLNTDSMTNYLAGDSSDIDYPGDPGAVTGGNGQYYADNDGVPFSRAPRLQLIDLGFNTIYKPTPQEVRSIAEWLWSDDFTDNIHLNYIDPFNNIVMLAMCPIRESDLTVASAPFKIGNTYMSIGSQYTIIDKVIDQYVELYCGTRTISGYWNNFLDYEATYTLYLPFVGFRSLKTDDIVNSDITIKYIIDVLTGHATAEVGCVPFNPDSGERGKLSVLYSFPCNIYYNMAFSGANFISQYSQQLSATSSGINNAVSAAGQMASGNLLGAVAGIANLLTGSAQAKMQYDTAKPDYGRGGNNSGNIGLFSCRYPYIVRSLPITQSANNYNQLRGVPLQLDYQLSDLTGYTEIEAVVVDTLSNCTTDEKNAIVDMLKSGVYL